MKKSIDQIDVRGRRVLVRLDLNVPLNAEMRVTDDRRIREALPTVKRLLDGGAGLILMSHLGRPEGKPEDRRKFSLAPVARTLEALLGRTVRLLDDCTGDSVRSAVQSTRPGDVLVLENLRFHEEETIKDKKAAENPELRAKKDSFARELAALGDVYVNDAFGTCHRDNVSMLTLPALMVGKPRVVGYLVQRELKFLGEAVSKPARPFVCVLGGRKISDKLGVIRSLLTRCDMILVGGAMAYTFLSADGLAVGKSLVETDLFDTARSLRADAKGKLKLPTDSVAAAEIRAGTETKVCTEIPSSMMGLDIGPRTIEEFSEVLRSARTIVWNGPMGVFETPPFDRGTIALAEEVAKATDRGAVSIVGGGDSAAAVERAGVADRITHISTGGGASLEFLEGKRFAALDVLDDA